MMPLDDGGPRIDTAEGIVRRIASKKELSYDTQIFLLEEVIDSSQVEADHMVRLYEEIDKAHKNGYLDSDEFQKFLADADIMGFDGEVACPVFYQVPLNGEVNLYWAVKEWPFMTPEIHAEVLGFIEIIRRALNMFRDNELSKAVLGTPQKVLVENPVQQVKFSTIQWRGKTEDFHRLCDHLEKVLWLAPRSHAGLSRFFFDSDGNPMSSNTDETEPPTRIQWVGLYAIDFYRLSWYLDETGLIPEGHLAKFARLFLDRSGKPMKEDSSSLKSRDGIYEEKLDPKVKDFVDRILENKRK